MSMVYRLDGECKSRVKYCTCLQLFRKLTPNLHLCRPRILISDFGECEVLDDLPERDRTGATGALEFMAPELIRLDDHGKHLQEFSPKADMWSLGMVLYYLCYSRLPYHYINDIDRLKDEILAFEKCVYGL